MSGIAANRRLRACLLVFALGAAVPALAEPGDAIGPVIAPEIAAASAMEGAAVRLAFDWFSNASPVLPGTRTKALRRVIPGPGGWICSPAGFGQHSTCYQG